MTELYYVELQDSDGTGYGITDRWTDEPIYFEDLGEARMYAKSQISDEYIVARVIDDQSRVVDFFVK